ncbi:MAG TPA: phospholipase D-like domain-containing protein [Parafilimonas sp.]|nr:phospholipase D-like domain-containing protein [Parafilimonas sp.]
MFTTNAENGCSVKAYRGSLTTMLSMDLAEKPQEGSFAGFTIYYVNLKGQRNAIQNLLNFQGVEQLSGSDIAPIQAFKWVHFPGSYHQTGMLSGKYTYEVTPRYFDNNRALLPIDASNTVKVTGVEVDDYSEGKFSIGFTRAFVKSQAFSNRYGATQKLLPGSGDWIFNTNEKAGNNAKYGDFTYEDMYAWLGFNARTMIYGLLTEALHSTSITVDMFAYDFNDPVIADLCLQLSAKGRIRIILDNANLHMGGKEDDFEQRFNAKARNGSAIYRCKFGRYAHCKEIILKKKGVAFKALTGSTNFSYTGLYVNANHVLLFEEPNIAKYYADVFDVCWQNGKAASFRKTNFANGPKQFKGTDIPSTEINVSPHTQQYAEQLIDAITSVVTNKQTSSVIFSVMEMGKTSTGSLIPALRELHKNDSIYTYGITDNSSGEISLYKPGKKEGLLIDAKKANRELPPPFKKEFSLGLMHAIHHKFVVTDFNKPGARVYCGSSNLALGGEQENGDNLLCIQDTDAATVFAIEGLRLTDHYNYRSLNTAADKSKDPVITPAKLDDTGKWVERFYNSNDIRCVERKLLA